MCSTKTYICRAVKRWCLVYFYNHFPAKQICFQRRFYLNFHCTSFWKWLLEFIFCIWLFPVYSYWQWNWNCVVWIFFWNWGAECVWNGQFPKCQAIIRINLFSCLPLRQKKNYKFKRHPCYYWGKEHTKITQKIEIFSRGIGFYGNPKLHLWAREKQQQFRWQHIYNIKLVVVVKQILVRIRPT